MPTNLAEVPRDHQQYFTVIRAWRLLLVVKPRTGYSLRSDSETLLVIPKVTRKTFGDRAFFHAGPTVWNALPSSLRNCRNIDSFKVQLKTYLFKKAFNL